MNNVTSFVAVKIYVLHQIFDLIKVFANSNSATSVGVFAWLDDPEVASELGVLVKHGLSASISLIVNVFKLNELRVT